VANPVPETLTGPSEAAPPDWSALSPEPERSPERAWIRILVRALGAAAFVVVLWWPLGRPVAAIVLLAVAGLLTLASSLSDTVARGVDRVESVIQRVAGKGLRAVLLAVVDVLVFIPIAAVLRLLGHDPLARGSRRDDASFWRPTPGGGERPLHRRQFAYERLPIRASGVDRLPLRRVRGILGLVALLILLDVGIGAAIDALRGDGGAATQRSQGSLLLYPDVAAGRAEPWRTELGREITQVWQGKRYHPYLGWTPAPYSGRYVHVAGGVRRSYEPPGAAAHDALTVYFFGGSAMFGMFQRDDRTIPSDVARLAAADGLHVRVVNYGVQAYANWQETLLLERLITEGRPPDLAVFYDGANQLVEQFEEGPHRSASTTLTREIAAKLGLGRPAQTQDKDLGRALYDAWADKSALHSLAQRLGLADQPAADTPRLQSPWVGDQGDHPERRGRYGAEIYARGVTVARRLSRSYGFQTAFFWQPLIYSKQVRPGEEMLLGSYGNDPAAWRAALRAARANLPPGVDDVSGALDAVKAPVMYDFVHTNEAGAQRMAQVIYARLRPQLERLAAARGGS
jgi:hypothetical protein